MIFIAHRGNIKGKNPDLENSPTYVDSAILHGFNCEVDAWVNNGLISFGHDKPEYHVEKEWLEKRIDSLWIHCKNNEALDFFVNNDFHCFFHNIDGYTMTSKGFVWAYPGMPSASNRCISVMPEISGQVDEISENSYVGVCSDVVAKIMKQMENFNA